MIVPAKTDVRSVTACIGGNFLYRMSAEATAITLGLYLSYINNNIHPISAFVVGIIGTGYYIIQMLAAPLAGAASDRTGRKTMLLLGPAISVVVVLLYPATALVPVIFLLLTLEGLNAALRAPAALSYLSDVTAHSVTGSGRVMGIYQMTILGSMVAGYVMGGFAWDRAGLEGFRAIALVYLAGVAVILFALRPYPPVTTESRHTLHDYLRVATHPSVLRFLPAWVGLNAILSAWLSQTTFQLSAKTTVVNQALLGRFTGLQIGLILAVVAVLFAAGTVGWGFMIGKLTKLRIMMIATTGVYLCCVALFVINRAPQSGLSGAAGPLLTLAVATLTLGVTLQSGFTPAAFAYLGDVSGQFRADRGAIIGMYYLFLSAGQLLGIWLGGVAAHIAQLDGLIILTVILTTAVFATLL